MTVELSESDIQEAKYKGQIQQLREELDYYKKILAMSVGAHARAERELGETKHELKQANVLASRYTDLLCTIVELANLCDDIPRDVALVVQEARAVAGCP